MSLIICPGIHSVQLTQDFLEGLHPCIPPHLREKVLVYPTQDYPAYSAWHILEFMQRHKNAVQSPVTFIGFSAGVVGAMGAAWGWQLLGGTVKALFAFDGWGVPLMGDFPIYRVSHDYFTHWSSAVLGTGAESFYADPPVEHLPLWGQPDVCEGWWVNGKGRQFTTAARFVCGLL